MSRAFFSKSILVIIPIVFILSSCSETAKPLTKEEVTEFAKQVEISIEKKDAQFMDDAIAEKELLKRTTIPSGKNENSFRRGLAQSMKFGTAIINSISAKGSYKLVRQYEKDKAHHLLFRLYDQGKINYHDIELIRSKGKCKIADMFIYLSGENFSATLYSIYVQMSDEIDKSSKMSAETKRWTQKMPEIRSLINTDRHREAKDIYDALPGKIKSGRPFQIMYLQICSGLADEEYENALQEFERLYPNEPNIHLLMVDGYIIRKQYDKALNAVNELDKAVGKDPILDFHRSACYTFMGDAQKSRECLERLVKNIPDFEEGLLELIKAYLVYREYDKAKPLVDRFKNKSEFDQSDLNTLMYLYPGYNEKFKTD